MSSSPPSRPIPPTPTATASSPTPSPLQTTSEDDVDSLIDASTLSLLSSSLRTLFLPWLFRLVVFTSCAKLLRFSSPYLFLALRWAVHKFWTCFEVLVKFLCWAGMWGGMAATALWVLGGVATGIAYGGIKLKPRWRVLERERPALAAGLTKGGAYGLSWVVVRRVLGRLIAKILVVVVLGWEAYTFYQRRSRSTSARSRFRPVPASASAASPSSTSTPARPGAAPGSGIDDVVAEEEAERWARQVKEEMLMESLLRAGRKTATPAGGSESVERSTAAAEDEDDEDMPELEEVPREKSS